MSDADLASVGDHFIVGLRPTTTLHPLDRDLLRDLRPAGVILYKSNFRHDLRYDDWLASQAELIADIRGVIGRERIFIGIDHEGGRVCRTPPPITRYGYARSWGNDAGAVGAAMGVELASLGVNLSFAPVLDIDSNPKNPVIGARAFDSTPSGVSTMALQFAKQLEANGVRACGKHFPGHGDTHVDSHYELPVIGATLDDLRHRELQPFAAAVAAGFGMIMTSHILFRAIDPVYPATLSRQITHGLLREDLGFEGVIVSDDISMRAVSKLFDNADAAIQFMAAGNDLMMICAHWADTERARPLARRIIEARRAGDLESRELDRSKERIAEMLERTPQNSVRRLSQDVFARHAQVGALYSDTTAEVI
ncbi:glycoside hydrolase family 3 N-terminal domain-containing protein [Hyphomicrobium sp.]|uniref:glycoside hydrolase family 3 N-terminal domain-containing protein n=1 Tax=Hyphomicrobium sp. TaxID=82 RepID=UPI002C4232A5|nr:glycoside hydrolase family 3 N-terminal domain-containing protein [Hyphomicrobium sp.]HVZ04044.1 glycoside hydrolase family 3 N-terminal domain-containing protein [Hyphomicrobium sp.]